jgi:hypothetical protein
LLAEEDEDGDSDGSVVLGEQVKERFLANNFFETTSFAKRNINLV